MTLSSKLGHIETNKNNSTLLKRLQAIEDISAACSSLFSSDLSIVSNIVLESFCELTGADYGVFLLVSGEEKKINLSATYGFPGRFSDTFNKKLNFTFNSDEVSDNWPSVRSIMQKQPVLIRDISEIKASFSKFFIETIYPHTIKSVASIPIIINDNAIGAITKYYTDYHEFDTEEISFMKTTANIITSIIERNYLLEIARKSECELEKANNFLKKMNHELDSFVYIASHDLREPLRTIESFVDIIQDQIKEKLTEEQEDYFSRIITASQRMRNLIEDLTNLCRASIKHKDNDNVEVDINELLSIIQIELSVFIKNNNCNIEILNTFPKVLGNREKISSVFKNLIVNGIKFNESENKKIQIYSVNDLVTESDKLCICVEDNGIGIHKDYFGKIFGLFQRLHSQDEYEGTGAGLAIVKKILEKYGCDIWVESRENVGSRFYFTLKKT